MLKYLVEVMPEAVEARSEDQLTPLLRAFRLHNLEAAKILIEAGADQTARDKDGMNLLHQLLNPDASFVDRREHKNVNHIRNMIETIDKRLISSMCLQRASAHPGSLTPLAFWLAGLRGSPEFQADVTRLILEYGNGSELEALNGEGLTVLHTVAQMRTNAGSYHPRQFLLHAKVLLEHMPELVTWENATGKTSLELVEDKILALNCSGDDGNNDGRHRRRYHLYGRTESITDAPPRDFIKQESKRDIDMDVDSDSEQLHQHSQTPKQYSEAMKKLLTSTQAKLEAEGRGKRRLVTLHEASEVARRLAATQRKKVENEDEAVAGRGGNRSSVDVVERWIASASRREGPVL